MPRRVPEETSGGLQNGVNRLWTGASLDPWVAISDCHAAPESTPGNWAVPISTSVAMNNAGDGRLLRFRA